MLTNPSTEISTPQKPLLSETRRPDALLVGIACVFFALAQLSWVGYQLGVGNQGIQIAFLEALHNPGLFSRDVMVSTTLGQYPSWFFALCAPLLRWVSVPALYAALHLLATVGTFLAVAALARAMFPDTRKTQRAGFITLLMLVAGHHQALAGEALYSTGLTHTWAAFPLTLVALVFFYREQYSAAFAVAGLTFNFHALEAGHLALVMGFVCLLQIRRLGFVKLLWMVNIFLIAAGPTLILMLRQHGAVYDEQWLQLMHVRSADHSFPSSWWQPGAPDVPRFLCIIGLAAVALGFGRRTPERRKTILLAVGVGLLFAAGYVFTEVWPVPLVIRAQFFRSSRVLLLLALVVIGHGCWRAWRLPWERGNVESAKPAAPRWRLWLEFGSAAFTMATLAIPSLLPLLPWALLMATVAALFSGRLAWYQALFSGAALLVCAIAWQRLQFTVPGLSSTSGWSLLNFSDAGPGSFSIGPIHYRGPTLLGWAMLSAAAAAWIIALRGLAGLQRFAAIACGGAAAIGLAFALVPALLAAPAPDHAWVDVQDWARQHSPPSALFLTPAQQSGFRIHSERAIVGEWRDGTQLYFSSVFTPLWWKRMNELQPGLLLTPDKRDLFFNGKQLGQLDDDQLIALAKRYEADYIVVPHSATRRLVPEYDNQTWAIYRPKLLTPPIGTMAAAGQQDFMTKVVLPAIEQNRKSDARVQVLDPSGRPIEGLKYALHQTQSAFGMGASLSYFKAPGAAVDFGSDYQPPLVTPPQLSRFLDVFNYSVIPFSGNWAALEPQQGAVDFSDLDQYVNWCAKNNVRVEFSFLSGNLPDWVAAKSKPEQARLTIAHARQLVERYGVKINQWQVISENIGEAAAPGVFAELRKISPKIQLGIADDARFWSPRVGPLHDGDTLRGLEEIRALKSRGVKVDFVSIEARQPIGLWADPHEMYQYLDAFAQEGVRVHITQVGVPVGGRIAGPVRQDIWTPELQAAYYEQFFTVCYSHPAVDAVNLMALGAKSWLDGEGLLDDQDRPTPAFDALRELITKKWRTEASGTFGLDGTAAFRGFQGDYELTATLPSGQSAKTTLRVSPMGNTGTPGNEFRFQFNAKAGTLIPMENH